MPFTASKTDADTKATTRDVTSGFVPPAITVSFMIAFHSSTGSGGPAAATGTGRATQSTPISRIKPMHARFFWILTKTVRRNQMLLIFLSFSIFRFLLTHRTAGLRHQCDRGYWHNPALGANHKCDILRSPCKWLI